MGELQDTVCKCDDSGLCEKCILFEIELEQAFEQVLKEDGAE